MRIAALVSVLMLSQLLSAQRLLGVHADASGPALSVRIPEGLSVVVGLTAGTPSVAFRYGNASSGIWIYDNLPAGDYEMWHSAPGFQPAAPWALSNPVSFDPAAGDTWASSCLTPDPSMPTVQFQISGLAGQYTVGGNIDLDFGGQPGSVMNWVVASSLFLPPIVLPGIGSLMAFDVLGGGATFVNLGLLGQTGHLLYTATLPNDPSLAGGLFFFQGLEASANGLLLSNLLAVEVI